LGDDRTERPLKPQKIDLHPHETDLVGQWVTIDNVVLPILSRAVSRR
jgi:hypothetical protein